MRPLLVYFGHHKCATRWINSIVRGVSRELGLRHATVWSEEMFQGDLAGFVRENRIEVLSYTNADYRHVLTLPDFRGFHVVRDPRDICVSAYFSHLKTHETKHWPELLPHRARLNGLDKEEGLLIDMDFNRDRFANMSDWNYHTANIYETRLETLTQDPFGEFVKIFSFLHILDAGRPTFRKRLTSGAVRRLRRLAFLREKIAYPDLPLQHLERVVDKHNFANKARGREQGSEDRSSHYRKGQPGDWANHFTERHVMHFKVQFNPLLLKLGYEEDEDWS